MKYKSGMRVFHYFFLLKKLENIVLRKKERKENEVKLKKLCSQVLFNEREKNEK